jgi:DNA replication protein DnaC
MEPPTPLLINPDSAEIENLLRFKPMTDAEFRAYVKKETIFPTLGRWGFDKRFHIEQEMPDAQRAVFLDVLSMCKGVGAIVALVGPRGLGKTTITAQIAIRQAWSNYQRSLNEPAPLPYAHVVYYKTAWLVSRYKPLYADYGSVETNSLQDGLDYLCRDQELLVIDELHDCDDQKMKLRVLTDLVDRRYAALRDTILISNQTAEEFSETAGGSIISRLGEHGAIIECRWESFR